MKYHIVIFLVLFTITVKGQTKREIKQSLKKIESREDFEKFKSENDNWNIELIKLNTLDSVLQKKLSALKKGKIRLIKTDDEKYYYKLINSSKETEFRASYIYLNVKELKKKEIDSIRPVIIKKYKSGVSFTDLVKDYNMDGNTNKGDLGWFKKGKMVPDFEKAVIKHKKSDIFIVDVDNSENRWHDWYYVVLKTHNDRIIETKTFIRIKKN